MLARRWISSWGCSGMLGRRSVRLRGRSGIGWRCSMLVLDSPGFDASGRLARSLVGGEGCLVIDLTGEDKEFPAGRFSFGDIGPLGRGGNEAGSFVWAGRLVSGDFEEELSYVLELLERERPLKASPGSSKRETFSCLSTSSSEEGERDRTRLPPAGGG